MTTQAPMRNVQIHISHGHNILPNPPTVGQSSGRTIQININKNMQNRAQNYGNSADLPPQSTAVPPHSLNLDISNTASGSNSPCPRATNQSPVSITSTVSTPSSNSDNIPDKPPPPYPGRKAPAPPPPDSDTDPELPPPLPPSPLHRNCPVSDNDSVLDDNEGHVVKHRCTSPIPERKPEAKWKDEERREFKVKNYSPQAFKFYMEQHMENVLKSHQQRLNRRIQLENEMAKVGLSEEAQCQMRKMLHQKESNYIRLKRAKMDKAMFESISTLGVGAFGKVALVRKRDTGHLYAMKTLRKCDVLKRNQVAHVKAERDILAEADNEWVVKLYYSFQDTENLYFVMDYIPGGDMMSLLIKFGIFQEQLARFYIAELVLAIESVHKMGFIHRDIKPDNILIDRDGHIKLTDFGLCTGFRWTHNSKVYQKGELSYPFCFYFFGQIIIRVEAKFAGVLATRGLPGDGCDHASTRSRLQKKSEGRGLWHVLC
jgi:serine/threonine-protein kinase LATS1/2